MKIERLKKKKWCKFICYLIIVAFILEIPMPAYASINLGDDAIVQSDDTTGSVDNEATNVFENVDLEYILIGSKIKENFIINDAKSPSQ